MFCKSCGTQLPNGANYCMKCGYTLRGQIATQPKQQGHWEYTEFSQSLGGVVIKRTTVFGGINASGSIDPRQAVVIEKGVQQILKQYSNEGWEPNEPIDAGSLAKSNRVEWRVKEHMWSWNTSPDVNLDKVKLKCRRWVT
jgi:hypothetical protein